MDDGIAAAARVHQRGATDRNIADPQPEQLAASAAARSGGGTSQIGSTQA
jgi:hypothetical protein